MTEIKRICEKIIGGVSPTDKELTTLLMAEGETAAYLAGAAREICDLVYGKRVFVRGLIEISSYCKNDCLYCGIRRSNRRAERYRLTPDDILECAEYGYSLGFRTFVLQGGEDPYFTDGVVSDIVRRIKDSCAGSAVTLSLGERTRESYKALRIVGADRYLLRHETADLEHYSRLHPSELTLENRISCLCDLKALGFQTGCGFMVGSPFQTAQHLAKDLKFIEEFRPAMCGIGPFIPHKDTPFADHTAGTLAMTCYLLSLVRLIHPPVLLPSTTALGTIDENGREKGILAGANVVMPNLSPLDVRQHYMLYNGKIATDSEAAEGLAELKTRMRAIGYEVVTARGDVKG